MMHTEPIHIVKLPLDSRILSYYKSVHLSDAFMIRLNNNVITDPEALARFVFSQQASWVSALMFFREIFVGLFKLKTSSSKLLSMTHSESTTRIHYFHIYSSSEREVILGENDKHLDFRLSLLYRKAEETSDNLPQLIFSTVVHCHNKLGRVYLFLIAPFHRIVVRSGLRRSSIAGWPRSVGT